MQVQTDNPAGKTASGSLQGSLPGADCGSHPLVIPKRLGSAGLHIIQKIGMAFKNEIWKHQSLDSLGLSAASPHGATGSHDTQILVALRLAALFKKMICYGTRPKDVWFKDLLTWNKCYIYTVTWRILLGFLSFPFKPKFHISLLRFAGSVFFALSQLASEPHFFLPIAKAVNDVHPQRRGVGHWTPLVGGPNWNPT